MRFDINCVLILNNEHTHTHRDINMKWKNSDLTETHPVVGPLLPTHYEPIALLMLPRHRVLKTLLLFVLPNCVLSSQKQPNLHLRPCTFCHVIDQNGNIINCSFTQQDSCKTFRHMPVLQFQHVS